MRLEDPKEDADGSTIEPKEDRLPAESVSWGLAHREVM